MAEFLGIDVGSSFIKAAVFDVETRELGETRRVPFPEAVPGLPPLHNETDPCAVMAAVEDLLRQIAARERRFGGLLLCGQMHGSVLVDAGGSAVSNYISWQDQRVTRAEFDEMAARLTETEYREIGREFRAGIGAPVLCWLKQHGALPDGVITPVSIADYVAARLCGTRPVMEPTQAAAFGALRVGTTEWHEGVIEKLGLGGIRWPEVRPSGAVVGTWRGAPCYASVGDQQCALAGALLEDGELSVNIGTGSQVALIADTPAGEGCQTRPYFDGRLLRTITHIPGGRALSALIGLLTELGGAASEKSVWGRIESAVAAVPETDLRAHIAFFPGPCGHGGFLENLHGGNLGIGHVFRAVFESMARNYAACARRVDPDGEAKRVVFSGGVARRMGVLRELTAAALGMPSRLSPHPEDTMYGLMVLAQAFTSGRHSG